MKGTITISRVSGDAAAKNTDRTNKNLTPITNCIREINNNQEGNARDLDVAMWMYNLTEYGENYAKTSGSLWHYHKNDPNNNIKFKARITRRNHAGGNTKEAELVVLLKYFK